MTRTKSLLLTFLCLGLFLPSEAAMAQLAPTPKRAPRTPVKSQHLASSDTAMPTSRVVTGLPSILESDRLKINAIEMRLFGVVPPVLSASYGPQARSVIDAVARGSVTCTIRDRDKSKQLLASCQNEEHMDFGLELLRRGLAVTARGTLHSSDLAIPYISAEEAAKAQHLGLWSINQPAGVSQSDMSMAQLLQKEKDRTKAEEEKRKILELEMSTLKAHQQQKEQEAAAQAAANIKAKEEQEAVTEKTVIVPLSGAAKISPLPLQKPEEQLALAEEAPLAVAPAPTVGTTEAAPVPQQAQPFAQRYQLLISSLLLLLSAGIGAGSFAYVRTRERKESLRAVAAALRGELMAARSVCLARLAKMAHEGEERPIKWPRLRAIVFSAYVGQIGRLGADLSRQIASIYGQASDYASYYVGADDRPDAASKKQSLQTLVQHIEDVVPRLAALEQTGTSPLAPTLLAITSSLRTRATMQIKAHRAKAIAHTKPVQEEETNEIEQPEEPVQPPEPRARDEAPRRQTVRPKPEEEETVEAETHAPEEENSKPVVEDKAPTTKETITEKTEAAPKEAETVEEKKGEQPKEHAKKSDSDDHPPVPPSPTARETVKPAAKDVTAKTAAPPKAQQTRTRQRTEQKTSKTTNQTATQPLVDALHAAEKLKEHLLETARHVDIKTSLTTGFAQVKGYANEKMKSLRPHLSSSIEDIIPDYANLTEEEIEALAYAEDDMFLDSYSEDDRKIG